MPNHDTLQAIGLFVLIWASLFFGFLALPQFLPPPVNLDLALASTIVIAIIALAYFWAKRVRVPTLPAKVGQTTGEIGHSDIGRTPKQFELATYQELYDFAFNPAGMDLSGHEARQWAEDWLQHYSDKDFETFKRYYQYAWRPSGLGLSGPDARKWALDKLLKS